MRVTKWLLAVILGLVLLGSSPQALAVAEDLSAYNEIDTLNHISVTGNRADFTLYGNEVNTYLYRDKGAGYIKDFTYSLETGVTSFSAWYVEQYVWQVGNSFNNQGAIGLTLGIHSGKPGVRLVENYNWDAYRSPIITLSGGVNYRVVVSRTGSNLKADIYNGATLTGTTSLTLHSSTAYRYVFVVKSYPVTSSDRWLSGYVQNMDLNGGAVIEPPPPPDPEPVPPPPPPPLPSTFPPPSGNLTIAALADYQKSYDPTINNLVKTYAPTVTIHAGDLVHDGRVLDQWTRRWAMLDLVTQSKLLTIAGNHEYIDDTQIYYQQVDMPGNEHWYSYDVGNTHIIGLELVSTSRTIEGEQYAWLANDLAQASVNSNIKWKVLFLHVPLYSSGAGDTYGGALAARQALEPLFRQYGVDLVLGGHYHNYERTYQLGSNEVILATSNFTQTKAGTVYATIGGAGGGGNPSAGNHTWTAVYSTVGHFAVLTIGNDLQMDVRDIANNLIDTFTIRGQ